MSNPIHDRCAEVAEAVYPHNNWRNERARLTTALIALVETFIALKEQEKAS